MTRAWIKIGAMGAPAFENDWGNAGMPSQLPSFAAAGELTGDYAVMVTLGDGNSNPESHWGSLDKALEEANRVREQIRKQGYRKFDVGVLDWEDPERGWLTEEDL